MHIKRDRQKKNILQEKRATQTSQIALFRLLQGSQ
jgi:hypothetical protein